MAQKTLKLIIFLSLTFLIACNSDKDSFGDVRKTNLVLSSGRMLTVKLAITPEEQQQGLSGLKDQDFPDEEGMLFYYKNMGPKRFWMPDTYFNLDIIFLDQDMKVIAIERNVPAHPGRTEDPPIAQTRTYLARHVLELKANSQIAKTIREGDKIIWQKPETPNQIESSIRQKK
ncbi:MAG: hypothetical protein COW00_08460 [Bdellovibrio sp. CG12_big_fil_rev_8_21_14_0_65_39_13]|nr:MAG: hypothetical protein COW78_08530 [Bdellovibrio sp. CG22_combo_CG10-13_8_21_14_all_39_27]PIQ59656.1 MAG: hypothetical protein COW00_08460 [Bdellovibrio sp. CG12_big_fil_rev_8_21_14_0_65_39_13]PIR36311.1 MAG: hypothetical protein COV37_04920 [Bdellovibrio sp. CG11_big_fil_rev_8_21_14_0_20_39_38]